MADVKLGRKPRIFNPAVPHMSALLMGKSLPPPPRERNWGTKVEPDWGMMKNDELGDCTCAGMYHAMQLFSSLGRSHELQEPDQYVVRAYQEACGYTPGRPDTDQGGIE